MSDNTPNEPDQLVADTGGSNFTMPTYDIAPEDAALAAEIENFDPVYDVAGPTQLVGAVKLPSSIKASGLPPHLRDPIMAQLASVPPARRDAEEARLVNAALYENSLGVHIACGPGEGADPYRREKFALTFEMEETERRSIQIATELAEVVRWDNEDDGTGQMKPVPVYKVDGQRRAALEAEHRRLTYKFLQLDGPEGERRLAKAKFEAVEAVKAQRAQLAEDKEARTRADEILREERVAQRAELYAKHKRTVN